MRVADALLERAQEPVVIDRVEEFLDIHLDHDAALLAVTDDFVRAPQRLMR